MKLIAGSTGNVGGAVVQALRAMDHPVRAVVRAGKGHPRGVDVVEGDLDDVDSLVPHLDGVDGMFLLSGYGGTSDLLVAAAAAGVEHVVLLSAAGAQSSASAENAVAAYQRESEDMVRASDLAWTILRPTSFMTNALRWIDQLAQGDVVVEPFPEAAATVVDPRDIGAVAAAALVDRSLDGQALTVTGPEALLPAERLAVLGEALGRPLQLVGVDPGDVREHLLAEMPAPYADAFIEFFLGGTLDESLVTSTVEDAVGRPPNSFRHWVVEHLDRFRP